MIHADFTGCSLPGGEGVNLAMLDAWKLSQAIVAAHTVAESARQQTLDNAVYMAEQEMLTRAYHAQVQAEDLKRLMMVETGAPRKTMSRWLMVRADYAFATKKGLLSRWVRSALSYIIPGYCALYHVFPRRDHGVE
jgi:2-polyprenyl-6-methoxyphenol hydroxylase-like FAD-dependent oxidoreductase